MRLNNNQICEELENNQDILQDSPTPDELYRENTRWLQYQAAKTPTVAICPVWRDQETNTVVILSSITGRRRCSEETPEYYEYMSEQKRRSRLIMEDKEINAVILLGKSWRTRQRRSLAEFYYLVAEDVFHQVRQGNIIGDGDLSHLRSAARLLGKIVRHYERKGFRLNLYITGSEKRRSQAYFWLARRMGVKISNIHGLKDGDPSFSYKTSE